MRWVLFILVMLVSFSAEGQKRKGKNIKPPLPSLNDTIDLSYRYEPLFTKEQLRNQFPYSKSKKVVLLSYTCTKGGCLFREAPPTGSLDSIAKSIAESNIRKGIRDTLGYKLVREVVELNQQQTDSLNSLTHNMVSKAGMMDHTGCYWPRNSILFLGEDDKIVAFIDFCFECHGHESSFGFDIEDSRMYGMIRGFFDYVGVQYGITEKD